jgi:LysR family glycine cleavage system transcriptional activator
MLDAAVQGQGICLTSYFLAERDLMAGRLVRAFDLEIEIEDGFYLLSSAVYGEKPAIANFRQWIRAEAERAIAERTTLG